MHWRLDSRRYRLPLSLVFLAVVPGGGAADLTPVPDPDHVGLGGGAIAITESRPGWRVKERNWASDRPLFLSLRLGDAGAVLHGAVDESGGNGSGHDVLYVDTDGDADLSDEPALRPARELEGRTTSLRTDPVRVAVQYADGSLRKVAVRIAVSGVRDPDGKGTAWSAQCHVAEFLAGAVDIGERRGTKIAILDRSFAGHGMNACFNDYGVDRLRIDLDGDGEWDPGSEEFPLSKVIRVDGKLWELATGAAASRVAVRPCTLPTGRVKLWAATDGDGPVTGRAELVSGLGFAFTYDLPNRQGITVPEGRYRISRAALHMADAAQRTWSATFSVSNTVAVVRDRESPVQLGAPFKVVPVTEGEFRLGDRACITAHLYGAAGEEYLNMAPRQMRMKPAVRIEDAVEIVVAEGNMEYG